MTQPTLTDLLTTHRDNLIRHVHILTSQIHALTEQQRAILDELADATVLITQSTQHPSSDPEAK